MAKERADSRSLSAPELLARACAPTRAELSRPTRFGSATSDLWRC